ncbi:MAG: hypothetical protein U0Y82_10330 [Thermoleophilia bacterium]
MDLSFVTPWRCLARAVALVDLGLLRWRRHARGLPFPSLEALEEVTVAPRRRRHLPLALAALGALALTAAVARPQMPRSVREDSAISWPSASGSMAADDISPARRPGRREAFADRVPAAYQVGLVAFAGSAAVIVPPTTDRDQLRASPGRWGFPRRRHRVEPVGHQAVAGWHGAQGQRPHPAAVRRLQHAGHLPGPGRG